MILGREGGSVALILFVLLGIYFFALRGMRFFEVPSRSMEPTLTEGDHIITLNNRAYERGDIVVMRDEYGYMVKRIAGVGGDELMVVDGALFVNGAYASEPYIREPMEYMLEPVRVPEGYVFVLGDNRNESDDSHLSRKAHSAKDIVGRVVYRYYPYGRLGPIPRFPLAQTYTASRTTGNEPAR
jgi:signal peptidase I